MTESSVKSPEPVALGIPSRKLTIGLYLASVFLFWMAQYIYLPTLPTYVQSKANDLAVVGVVLFLGGISESRQRRLRGEAS